VARLSLSLAVPACGGGADIATIETLGVQIRHGAAPGIAGLFITF